MGLPTQDEANTMRQLAETARVLKDMGFPREAAVKAVTSGDLSTLA